jgi:hypothetical protein
MMAGNENTHELGDAPPIRTPYTILLVRAACIVGLLFVALVAWVGVALGLVMEGW